MSSEMDSVAEPPGEQSGAAGRSVAFVQSLERGLAVIRAFDARRPSLTLSEVAKETGLSRAAARRFLHTLVELGYVASSGRAFSLRPRVLDLGHSYLSNLGLPELARPHLERLTEEVGESSSVAILDEDDVVYVARVTAYRIMATTIGVGTRFPAFATSLGRAMIGAGSDERREAFLANVHLDALTGRTITDPDRLRAVLDEVNRNGWALVDQELEEGLRSVAVPLRDASGEVVAAVNVSAPVRRGDIQGILEDLLPSLRRAAKAIEDDMISSGTRIR